MQAIISAAPFLFAVLVVAACGTAVGLGGNTGRWTALLYVTACLSTTAVYFINWNWARPNYLVAGVDTALLIGLYTVALRSRRYWPLWLCGLHLLTVCAHLSAIGAPQFAYRVYFVLEAGWSLPKMGVLLIGVLADWRRDRDGRANLAASPERAG